MFLLMLAVTGYFTVNTAKSGIASNAGLVLSDEDEGDDNSGSDDDNDSDEENHQPEDMP